MTCEISFGNSTAQENARAAANYFGERRQELTDDIRNQLLGGTTGGIDRTNVGRTGVAVDDILPTIRNEISEQYGCEFDIVRNIPEDN